MKPSTLLGVLCLFSAILDRWPNYAIFGFVAGAAYICEVFFERDVRRSARDGED